MSYSRSVDATARPTTQAVADAELDGLRTWLVDALPGFLADLERLVNIDCGSLSIEGVNEVGRWLAAQFAELGADVEVVRGRELGDTVVGRWHAAPDSRRLVLVGHMDTVFAPGTVAARPYREDNGRALGPGVSDMKAGLLAGLYALRALRELGGATWPPASVTFVANPDEELASPESTPVVKGAANEADAAFVLECARANGDIVSSRKGVADLVLRLIGRAAHAGVEPEKGRSAIVEAAHKILALSALNGRWPGVTLNVGVMSGGTRPNVVPAEAMLHLDLRAIEPATMRLAEAEIERICATSTVPDVTCEIERGGRFGPMVRSAGTARLADSAVALAGRLGFSLRDAATGGGSDAGTISALGVPVLDGLGPIGGDDHAPGEYLEIDSIVPRTALLAALLLSEARRPA
jgi:glutamate carboxypeptidase